MDCLRSFNVAIVAGANEAPPEAKFWTIGGQHFWLYSANNPNDDLTIVGFKNINIYKVEINGEVYSASSPVGVSAIVENWHVLFQINGQNSTFVGGNIVTGGFNLLQQPNDPVFVLSKYQRSVTFETPIQSATKFIVSSLYADGKGNESNVSVQLSWFVNFTIFYKYEGE